MTQRPTTTTLHLTRYHNIQGYNGHAYTAKLLLDNGADCEATDSHGDTALAVAEIGEAERRERHLGTTYGNFDIVLRAFHPLPWAPLPIFLAGARTLSRVKAVPPPGGANEGGGIGRG